MRNITDAGNDALFVHEGEEPPRRDLRNAKRNGYSQGK